jgi:integrator complex subunit 10
LRSLLQERVFSENCTDTALAHLIVLLQYDWPHEEELFMKIVELISQRQSLTYNMFFSYVFGILG